MCVPYIHDDMDFVGDVTEWISYYSREIVYPEYYETLMCQKVGRGDENSKKALDILFNDLVHDAAMNYESKHFFTHFGLLVLQGNKDLKSFSDSNMPGERAYIENLNSMFLDLANE